MKALTRNLVVVLLSTLFLTAVVSAQEIAVIETKFGKIDVELFEDKAPAMPSIVGLLIGTQKLQYL